MKRIIAIMLLPLLCLSISCKEKKATKEASLPPSIPEELIPLLPTMVTVKGGTFLFEGGEGEPVKTKVSTFQIADTEVTLGLFRKVRGKDYNVKAKNHPVHGTILSWVINFCNRLSEFYGYIPCYSGDEKHLVCDFTANGFRLPTSAEWEFAAKGGTKSKGYIYSGSNDIDEVAWYGEKNIDNEHEVAQKKPNELGLYDMSGNQSELCWTDGHVFMMRGGDRVHPEEFSRVSHPGYDFSVDDEWLIPYGEASSDIIGFRICRTITEK